MRSDGPEVADVLGRDEVLRHHLTLLSPIASQHLGLLDQLLDDVLRHAGRLGHGGSGDLRCRGSRGSGGLLGDAGLRLQGGQSLSGGCHLLGETSNHSGIE